MNALSLKNISFSYEKELILENINLEIQKEDFLVIVGPNGGGKSTLLKLMLGLLKPNSGEIKIFGSKPYKNNALAYVPQNTNINQYFPITALEVALMGRLDNKIFTFYNKEDKNEAMQALKRVGMEDFASRNISDLSGGQRQRVFIARALCANSQMLLLDEPTASIDTKGQLQIYELLKQLNKNIGIITVSHDINVSINFANKVAHVNRSLYMHDVIPKQTELKNLEKNEHICSIEIIEKNLQNFSNPKGAFKWKS